MPTQGVDKVRQVLRKTKKQVRYLYDGVFGPIPKPEKWVFIVGCYNSGTTLLHSILATHPEVGTMPAEGHFLTNELLEPQAVGLARLWAIRPEQFCMDDQSKGVDVERLMRQWGAQFNDPTRKILLEKTPVNAARTRWLQKHFPQAHFIGIIRNGYAVAEGIHRKADHALELAARQWTASNEIMLADFEHLHKKMLLRYEELTESPKKTVYTILDFLGISADTMNVSDRSWQVHEKVSTIKNMNARSFKALKAKDRETIEDTAGEMLRRLGYPKLC